ncbi:cytochrome P450 family protein [Priestia megaterium]|jgi:cytochrome P450|uniref:cytochrome P450 family protein n=1 Tax=Priestia megaterium TaxID=1404 RepID=UPI0028569A2D|nr:cytochrome P450 [Priestia megaterium]MDR7246392.1 cytochrome P450 [Priestia megaterium]
MSIKLEHDSIYPKIDLFSTEFKHQAYKFYDNLRISKPIYPFTLPNNQKAWLITRYKDALMILKDKRFIKNPYTLFDSNQLKDIIPVQEMEVLISHMLNSDPPDHNRLRNLVHKAFTSKTIENLRGQVQDIANDLLDSLKYKNNIDLINEYAFPLPMMVIGKMLGIPEKDFRQFRDWSNTIIEAGNLPDKMHEALLEINSFRSYLSKLIKNKRQNPGVDLITTLIHAEDEGQFLTERELHSTIFLLIIAGHETTVNLIGNGVLALLENPEQLERLRENPNLIKSAVEEMLRFYSPVELTTNRWAREDIMIDGNKIKKGEMVVVSLASANRDQNQFKEPQKFDISREDNKHIAFGMGIHYCLGAPLARLEVEIAINTLLKKLPEFQLNNQKELSWRPSYLMRGLDKLPITILY